MQAKYSDVMFWSLVVVATCATVPLVGLIASVVVLGMGVDAAFSLWKKKPRNG